MEHAQVIDLPFAVNACEANRLCDGHTAEKRLRNGAARCDSDGVLVEVPCGLRRDIAADRRGAGECCVVMFNDEPTDRDSAGSRR